MLPFVHFVNAGMLATHDLVLKLRATDDLEQLLEPEAVTRILSAYATDPALGVVAADSSLGDREQWGRNRHIVDSLLQRIQLGRPEQLEFVVGGSLWMRGFVARSLRALQMSEWDFEDEFGQADETTAFALERVIGILVAESGFETRGISALPAASAEVAGAFAPDVSRSPRLRAFAIFDASMSRAYGEVEDARRPGWPTIASSRPSIRGQVQPKLPEALGVYDPTDDEVAETQARLAQDAGVEGFVYDYRLDATGDVANALVRAHIAGAGSTRYCLHWGRRDVERHADPSSSETEGARLIREIADLLVGERCLTLQGRPVVLASGLARINDLSGFLASWRAEALAAGVPDPFLVAVSDDSWSPETDRAVLAAGADAVVDRAQPKVYSGERLPDAFAVDERFRGEIRYYNGLVERAIRTLAEGDDRRMPSVLIDHDDTPARGIKANVVLGANPCTFRRWLELAAGTVADRPFEERILFIDAWNSWRTGAVLEPSRRFGTTYLDAVRDVLRR